MTRSADNRVWWKEAVVYQIYPASFKDSNGDGLGDIPGITSQLDHIQSLGADTIWLSPIFASPQKDMGYDVSDYRSIHPPYGTVEDVEQLIDRLHKRGMRLLMDLVVNHTSDQHAWFQDSRRSRKSVKRDWYYWRDPKYDADGNRQPPNNWASVFGGPAWHYDEPTGQYYLALFLPSQPDLNWENVAMREAVFADMRFWLDKGIDGFRIDSMNLMSKHPDLPDARIMDPAAKYQSAEEWTANGPKIHDYIRMIRTEVLDRYPRPLMTVGEIAFPKDVAAACAYVASARHELNMAFTSDIANMDFGPGGKYEPGDFSAATIRDTTVRWQTAMRECDGWNTVYLENHDSGRSISRYASDRPEHRAQAAQMLATYLCTLSGTLFILAGEEIGMANMPREWGIEHYIDVEGRGYYEAVRSARGADNDSQMEDVLQQLRLKSRDHGRLPMQWDASAHAGFTATPSILPWREVNPEHVHGWNVAAQVDDPQSVLSYWKRVLGTRHEHRDVFLYGGFEVIGEAYTGPHVLAYRRWAHQQLERQALVLLNFSDQALDIRLPRALWPVNHTVPRRKLIGSLHSTSRTLEENMFHLTPYEGVIYCSW